MLLPRVAPPVDRRSPAVGTEYWLVAVVPSFIPIPRYIIRLLCRGEAWDRYRSCRDNIFIPEVHCRRRLVRELGACRTL